MEVRYVFITRPWLALLPSIAFAVAGYRRRRVLAWLAATAWLLFAVYETAKLRRLLCTGECNIRIDLLLLYPVLLLVSIVALLVVARGRRAEI